MVRPTTEEKIHIFKIIKELHINGESIADIRDSVERITGLSLCRKTISNYMLEIFNDEWLAELEEQEKTMSRWKKEYSNDKQITKEEIYVEMLYGVANKTVDPDDFDKLIITS